MSLVSTTDLLRASMKNFESYICKEFFLLYMCD